GAKIIKSVLESAYSNAKQIREKKFNEDDLYVSKISVIMGPSLKRFRAMSMGRAGTIRKRTSHVLIELDVPKDSKIKPSSRTKRKVKTRKS
ncbi:MAG: uL22 family ribosomal protein, partial [Candidatus Omnitrophota bacterium]